MSIVWKKRVTDANGRETWVFDRETHQGLVMGEPTTREVRPMSDVWCDASFVQVWNPALGKAEELCLGYHFECSAEYGVSAVDIDPKILATEQARVKEAARVAAVERQRREAIEAEAEAERTLKQVKNGVLARVVKGRNTAIIGFEGRVFWMGMSKFGPKVGLKTTVNGVETVNWTAQSNIEVIVPGPKPGQTWLDLLNETREAEVARLRVAPKKGDVVRHESGVTGRVFWQKDERIGVTRAGAPKGQDALWCNSWEVEILNPDGSVKNPRMAPPTTPQDPAILPPDDETDESEPVVKPNPLAEFPSPLCDITEVREERGAFNAYDGQGNFVIRLPATSAAEILARLGR